MTGFNLPPGVNVNYIPGNRPEDVEQDVLMTEFYEGLSADEVNMITGIKMVSPSRIDLENIIWEAIEFGRKKEREGRNEFDEPTHHRSEEEYKEEFNSLERWTLGAN